MFEPTHDAFFIMNKLSRHLTFKYQLLLDNLPVLKKLKILRPDLYIFTLTYHLYLLNFKDLTYIYMYLYHHISLWFSLLSYCSHLIDRIKIATTTLNQDSSLFITCLINLPIWSPSSTNWFLHDLVWGFIFLQFASIFSDLQISHQLICKVMALYTINLSRSSGRINGMSVALINHVGNVQWIYSYNSILSQGF